MDAQMKTMVTMACALAFTLTASVMATPMQGEVSGDIPVQDLLAATSTAFHQNASLRPTSFRDVEVRLLDQPSGKQQYVLCGEFLPAEGKGAPAKWLSFATVIHPAPSQWTGADATGLCQRATVAGHNHDLSISLLHIYAS